MTVYGFLVMRAFTMGALIQICIILDSEKMITRFSKVPGFKFLAFYNGQVKLKELIIISTFLPHVIQSYTILSRLQL